MQNSPNLYKPLPVTSFVPHQYFKAGHFSDILKPLRNSLFKFVNKPTEVTNHVLMTQDRKTISHTLKSLVPTLY